MKSRPVTVPLQPLPYAFRATGGRLLVVGEPDLWTEEAILTAEWYGIEWHGESLVEILERGIQPDSPAMRAVTSAVTA
jgi:hypothetical protein